MEQPCIICDIVDRKIKSYIVYENDFFISFLDIRPLFLGHCLLAPKKHFHTIYDFPSSEGNALLQTIQLIGKATTKAMKAQGSFIAMNNIVSQSIDHMHLHIVPRNKGDGLKGFFWPRTKYEHEAQMLDVQSAIKKEIEKH